LIFEACDGQHTLPDIVKLVSQQSPDHRDMSREATFDFVSSTLQALTEKRLLDPSGAHLISREEFIKKWGTMAAILPALSIALPRPAAAASGCINHSALSCPTNNCAPCDGADQAECANCTCLTIYCTTGSSCANDLRLGTACVDNGIPFTFSDTKLSCASARSGVAFTQYVQSAGICSSAASFTCPSGQIYACCQCL